MGVEEALAGIDACSSLEELRDYLQAHIEKHGFASFNFLDVGNPHIDVPYYMGTTGEAWENDYRSNGFVHVDHCVMHARRTNLPFGWDDVPLPPVMTGPKHTTRRLMEAAQDHGFQNGLVIPFHYRDRLGRQYSSLSVFYWKDSSADFHAQLSETKIELQIVIIYWVQRAIDLVADLKQREPKPTFGIPVTQEKPVTLSDREKDILSWAARGKTSEETSAILKISNETVSVHMKNAMRKLASANKTQAAVKAVYLGLIDI